MPVVVNRILYLGPTTGTSEHRINSFRRLGFEVESYDPSRFVLNQRLASLCEWKISAEIPALMVRHRLLKQIGSKRFDLAFIDSGSLVCKEFLEYLRNQIRWLVNFNHDDPFSTRDGARFGAYRRALPAYDLVIVVREPNVEEAYRFGAREVMLSIRTADVLAHAPKAMDAMQLAKWQSSVLFVGTCMEDRGRFMKQLVDRGVPLAIYGSRWEKAPEWESLRGVWRGSELVGDEYCYAIQSAEICLGMLSSGNRDLHTTRSLEIPRLGGLFCAPRTTEHTAMYREGREAVFWSSSDECADICLRLLASDPLDRERIALAGQARCLKDNHTNDNLILKIIGRLSKATAA